MTEQIENEIVKSINASIDKFAEQYGCSDNLIQIAMEKTADSQLGFQILKEYKFVRSARFGEVVSLPLAYALFKPTIIGKLNSCLMILGQERKSEKISIFFTKSKNGKIRIMLYDKGAYQCELSTSHIMGLVEENKN